MYIATSFCTFSGDWPPWKNCKNRQFPPQPPKLPFTFFCVFVQKLIVWTLPDRFLQPRALSSCNKSLVGPLDITGHFPKVFKKIMFFSNCYFTSLAEPEIRTSTSASGLKNCMAKNMEKWPREPIRESGSRSRTNNNNKKLVFGGTEYSNGAPRPDFFKVPCPFNKKSIF